MIECDYDCENCGFLYCTEDETDASVVYFQELLEAEEELNQENNGGTIIDQMKAKYPDKIFI